MKNLPTCYDHVQYTDFFFHTVCGHVELIDLLLEEGAALSVADGHSAYPLHYAAQMTGANGEGSDPELGLQTLNKLLSKNVPVDCIDQDERTPLLWAASSGEHHLINHHCSQSCPIITGSSDACISLLKAGSNIEDADKDGLTGIFSSYCSSSIF
jgi:ankyrin repeat protein